MRQIKFRAWDTRNKKWVFSEMAQTSKEGEHTGHFPVSVPVVYDGNWECVIMQFTNLLDSKGKEIYESDLIEDCGRIFEVYWNTRGGQWRMKNVAERGQLKRIRLERDAETIEGEVIGNSFENPELLTQHNPEQV